MHRIDQYHRFWIHVFTVAVIVGIMVGICVVHADVSILPRKPQRSNTILTAQLPLNSVSQPVYQTSATLLANQPVILSGTLQTTAEWLGSLQAQVLYCHAPGITGRYSTWTTTNHLGQENGAADGAVVTTTGQWLFTPPVTATYTCTLYGKAGRAPYPDGWPLEYLTVVGGNITIDPTPRLMGVEWRQPEIIKVGGENGAYKWVLVKRLNLPIDTSLRLSTGTQLSSISIGQSGVAVANVTTYITQLTTGGQRCARSTKTTQATVSGKLHHLKIHHTLNVPYNPACSPTFAIQVKLEYVSGQGMQVEGPSYTSAYLYPQGS